jgi:hypothetical protein
MPVLANTVVYYFKRFIMFGIETFSSKNDQNKVVLTIFAC